MKQAAIKTPLRGGRIESRRGGKEDVKSSVKRESYLNLVVTVAMTRYKLNIC